MSRDVGSVVVEYDVMGGERDLVWSDILGKVCNLVM